MVMVRSWLWYKQPMNGVWRKARCFPQTSPPPPQPLCHNPGLTSTNSDSTSNQVFVSFSQKWQNFYYACYKMHLHLKCLHEKYFCECERQHFHHSQHPNSLHCPLHWRSFRDKVNICWNHTKPNCNARNRADSINHTSNLYVEICLYVPENGYWNQIIHSIHSVYCGWKSLSKLVVLIKTLRMILRERRHFFDQGTLCL